MPTDADYLGAGVWIDAPYMMRKASSFDGYVAANNHASVSLQVDRANLEDVRKHFEPANLKRQGVKLIEMRDVQYGDSEKGLFTIVHDKRKGTYRYLLSIARESKVYNIKGFCMEPLREKYETPIKMALKSAYFGDEVEQKEPFTTAFVQLPDSIWLTRDGKWPTEAKDSAVIRAMSIAKGEIQFDDYQHITRFAKEKVLKTCDLYIPTASIRPLENGKFVEAQVYQGGIAMYMAMLLDPSLEGDLFICTSKDRRAIVEFRQFINTNFLKASLKAR